MSFPALLDNTCDIKEQPLTSDGQGGYSDDAQVFVYTNVPCRFEDRRSKEMEFVYDKKTIYPEYFMYLEWLDGVNEGMIVVFDSREFEIKLVKNWSERSIYMTLILVETKRMQA
jgi:hypothetical protein